MKWESPYYAIVTVVTVVCLSAIHKNCQNMEGLFALLGFFYAVSTCSAQVIKAGSCPTVSVISNFSLSQVSI